MQKIMFDEFDYMQKMYQVETVTDDNYAQVLKYRIKYDYNVLHMDKKEIYKEISSFLDKHYTNYQKYSSKDDIKKKIAFYIKSPVLNVDSVCIYQSELDAISAIGNIRKEKVMFVLLALAKYRNSYNPDNHNYCNPSPRELVQKARINLNRKDILILVGELSDVGLITLPNSNSSDGQWVNIVSSDEDDDIIMELHECDFKELAYTYLAWKNNGEGYLKCERCGCTIKKYKTVKYCTECAEDLHREQARVGYEPVGDKTVICVDCGKELQVSALDTRTCRCEECQKNNLRKLKREWKRNYDIKK